MVSSNHKVTEESFYLAIVSTTADPGEDGSDETALKALEPGLKLLGSIKEK